MCIEKLASQLIYFGGSKFGSTSQMLEKIRGH